MNVYRFHTSSLTLSHTMNLNARWWRYGQMLIFAPSKNDAIIVKFSIGHWWLIYMITPLIFTGNTYLYIYCLQLIECICCFYIDGRWVLVPIWWPMPSKCRRRWASINLVLMMRQLLKLSLDHKNRILINRWNYY